MAKNYLYFSNIYFKQKPKEWCFDFACEFFIVFQTFSVNGFQSNGIVVFRFSHQAKQFDSIFRSTIIQHVWPVTFPVIFSFSSFVQIIQNSVIFSMSVAILLTIYLLVIACCYFVYYYFFSPEKYFMQILAIVHAITIDNQNSHNDLKSFCASD